MMLRQTRLTAVGEDFRAHQQAELVVGRRVRVAGDFYGPDLQGHSGRIVSIDPGSLYPYNVAVDGVPGFDCPVVRLFARNELTIEQ